MDILILILGFVVGYFIFMSFAFLVAKGIFTPLDAKEEQIKNEKLMQSVKAKRIRKQKNYVAKMKSETLKSAS